MLYFERPETDGVRAKILLAPCLHKCNFSVTVCKGQFWMRMGASARLGHCVETDWGRHFHRIRLMDDGMLWVRRNLNKKEGQHCTGAVRAGAWVDQEQPLTFQRAHCYRNGRFLVHGCKKIKYSSVTTKCQRFPLSSEHEYIYFWLCTSA
jgi:hypothetical protein